MMGEYQRQALKDLEHLRPAEYPTREQFIARWTVGSYSYTRCPDCGQYICVCDKKKEEK